MSDYILLTITNLREASHIDFFHEKRHMDVWAGGGGGSQLYRFSVKHGKIR
jgi:hypothetical protein